MKRKAITPREMEAAYRLCLERERDRERKAKLTKQGAFESSFVHFDMQEDEAREHERATSWLTDGGRGARQIRRAGDPRPDPIVERQRRIDRAKHLVARHLPEYMSVLWLVIKNGNNRKESIWQLVRKTISNQRKSGTQRRPTTSRH